MAADCAYFAKLSEFAHLCMGTLHSFCYSRGGYQIAQYKAFGDIDIVRIAEPQKASDFYAIIDTFSTIHLLI